MRLARLKAFARGRAAPDAPASVHAPLIAAADMAGLAAQASLLATLPVREVHDHHAGDWASRWLGRGLDFEESRPYSPGDDIRDMDWRTTARTGRAHLKIYREERQPLVHLVVDRGATMRFGTRRRLKVAQAARVAAVLAFATAGRNGVIGATLWNAQDETLPARHGRLAALGLIEQAAAPGARISKSTARSASRWCIWWWIAAPRCASARAAGSRLPRRQGWPRCWLSPPPGATA
ncbi:MAG: DUF58 domain-containing protein [Candidatus Thermoplasmatota archaeon]|nr:DUF58 domain-containing protein [Candidatus Thermoplasmatota archaeon]